MGQLSNFDRKISNIRDMKEAHYSEKEIRELILKESYQLKCEIDRMYTDQLVYIEEVFNGS